MGGAYSTNVREKRWVRSLGGETWGKEATWKTQTEKEK